MDILEISPIVLRQYATLHSRLKKGAKDIEKSPSIQNKEQLAVEFYSRKTYKICKDVFYAWKDWTVEVTQLLGVILETAHLRQRASIFYAWHRMVKLLYSFLRISDLQS